MHDVISWHMIYFSIFVKRIYESVAYSGDIAEEALDDSCPSLDMQQVNRYVLIGDY